MNVVIIFAVCLGVATADLSAGTTFLVAIPRISTNDLSPQLILTLSAGVASTTVNVKYGETDTQVTVIAGTPTTVTLPASLRCMTSGKANNGILLTSQDDVSLQIHNFMSNGFGDVIRGFTLSDLSQEYYFVDDPNIQPVFTVVAIYPGTSVQLQERSGANWITVSDVMLQELRTFSAVNMLSLSEHRIVASGPVSVYMGGRVTDSNGTHTGEVFLNLPPKAYIGHEYFVTPSVLALVNSDPNGIVSDIKVISLSDNNDLQIGIFISNWMTVQTIPLYDGQQYDGDSTGLAFSRFVCSHPCMMVQMRNAEGMQPYISLIPDAGSFVNKAIFSAALDETLSRAISGTNRYLSLFTASTGSALTTAIASLDAMAEEGNVANLDGGYSVYWWRLSPGTKEISVDLSSGASTDVFTAWLVSETAPYGYGCVGAWGRTVSPLTPPPEVTTVADSLHIEGPGPAVPEINLRNFYLTMRGYWAEGEISGHRVALSRLQCANLCQNEAGQRCTSFAWSKTSHTCIIYYDVRDVADITDQACADDDACIADEAFQFYYDRAAHEK